MKIQLKGIISCILIVIIMLSAAGCWDMVEIDEKAFVLAMALDKFNYQEVLEKEEEGENKEQEAPEEGKASSDGKSNIGYPNDSRYQRMILTIVYPNVGLLTGKGGLIPEEMKIPLSTTGPNIEELVTMLSTRLSKTLSFEHTKVVLVGEELARDKQLFREVLDQLERDRDITRVVDFAIVEGKAQDVLFVKPKVEPIIGTHIEKVFEGRRETGRFLGRNLGEIILYLHSTGNALVPRVVLGKEEIKIAGSCVVKDYRMVGFLGELETRAVQLMDNMLQGGVYTVFIDEAAVPFAVTFADRKFSITADREGNIYLDINIKVEGDIEGNIFGPIGTVMDDKFIKKVEKELEKKIIGECSGVMDKMQHQFGVDLWGLDDYMHKFHHDLWEQIKDRWDQVYPEIKVNIIPDVSVRRIGIIK